MSELFAVFIANIWPIIIGLLALITGGAVLKAKRSNRKAFEAEERAAESERQVQEAQAVNTATERAHKAVERVRAKPLKKPSKKRDDFQGQ